VGHRFAITGVLAFAWVGLQAGLSGAAPVPDDPGDWEVAPIEIPAPEVPSVEDLIDPDLTIPTFTVPEDLFDPGVPEVPVDPEVDDTPEDAPEETPEDTPEGTPEDTPEETPEDTPEDTPEETPAQPEGSTTTTPRGEEASSSRPQGEELAYTGNDSKVPLAGAGLVAAGGLIAGLSILARRFAAGSQG
jgi:hypothetical protein